MRHYEVVFLVNPGQSEQMSALVQRYEGIIANEGGKVHRSEDWGRRPLAYPIQNYHKAHYWMFNIECQNNTLNELTEAFRFNDHVMRHMVVRRDEAITDVSVFAQEKVKEDERKAKAASTLAEQPEAVASDSKEQSAEAAASDSKEQPAKAAASDSKEQPAEAAASDSEEQPAESAAADSEE